MKINELIQVLMRTEKDAGNLEIKTPVDRLDDQGFECDTAAILIAEVTEDGNKFMALTVYPEGQGIYDN